MRRHVSGARITTGQNMVSLPPIVKTSTRWILSVTMVGVGIAHFTATDDFVHVMPAALPWHRELVWISGFFEIAGGVGLAIPRLRVAAAWGLIALYICVFPANINMAVNHLSLGDTAVAPWLLWARLPFQAVFIGLAFWFTRPDCEVSSKREAE